MKIQKSDRDTPNARRVADIRARLIERHYGRVVEEIETGATTEPVVVPFGILSMSATPVSELLEFASYYQRLVIITPAPVRDLNSLHREV